MGISIMSGSFKNSMKLAVKERPWIADVIAAMLGALVLVVLEFSKAQGYLSETIVLVLRPLGAALWAAAAVSFIIRLTQGVKQSSASTLMLVPKEFSPYRGDYSDRKFRAHEVDMLGVLVWAQLEKLAGPERERLRTALTSKGSKIRILILDPRAEYVKLRASEVYSGDAEESAERVFRSRIRQSIERCKLIYEDLKRAHDQNVLKTDYETGGRLEIRVTDHPPGIWMYRTDDEIMWGFYSSAKTATDSRTLELRSESDIAFFEELRDHFDKLWHTGTMDRTGDQSFLVRFGAPNPGPVLNKDLTELLLT